MINCPHCGSDETMVKDTRGSIPGRLRRRRVCVCGEAFHTIEAVEEPDRPVEWRKQVSMDVLFPVAKKRKQAARKPKSKSSRVGRFSDDFRSEEENYLPEG